MSHLDLTVNCRACALSDVFFCFPLSIFKVSKLQLCRDCCFVCRPIHHSVQICCPNAMQPALHGDTGRNAGKWQGTVGKTNNQ